MGYDNQDEGRHSSSAPSGSGRDGDQPPTPADGEAHGKQRPPSDHLQRVENNVQSSESQYSDSADGEVIDAELVNEITRRVGSYIWSAPAPSPETLESYKQIDPTFADRAMRMAEESITASNNEKEWLAKGDVDALKRGQFLSFFMFIASILAAILVFIAGGSELFAGVFLAPPVFQFLGKFVRTVREKEDDRLE